MSQKPQRQKRQAPAPQIPAEPEQSTSFFEKLATFWAHINRFGWDIVGLGLFALALVTSLGLLGWSKGAALTPWSNLLRSWVGWGCVLIPITFILLGWVAIRWGASNGVSFQLERILSMEAAAFCLLALFAVFGGMQVDRAIQGLDGGLVGWGIASIFQLALPGALTTFVLILLGLLFLAVGSGLFSWFLGWFELWLIADKSVVETVQPIRTASQPRAEAADEDETEAEVEDAPGPTRAGGPASRSATPRTRNGLPPLTLLQPDQPASPMDEEQIHATAALLEQTLSEYNIPARVVGFRVGPTVTQFAVEPGYLEKIGPDGTPVRQKIRVSQISALSRDLALALSAERLRIEAPVPGQSFVGIEVPNQRSSPVYLRSLLEGDVYRKMDSPLSVALGRDVSGQPVIADLARAPHMLIAGTTGSGKSVCITALTACLVLNNTPAELRIAMLDPKMVELVRYNGLPHLFGKVETEIDRMLGVLRWALAEMDRRYRLLEEARVRDLDAYNLKQRRKKLPILPRIVVLVDELADLMMSAPEQTENSIVRLAQMARATGIHLVVATQRPSTDVVTGLIKANFPFRISFTVASAVDSRVILDVNGAESLLGRGDMLVLNPEVGTPQRAQGVLVTDAEIERVVQFWQKAIPPADDNSGAPWEGLVEEEGDDADELVQQAIKMVRRTQKASASMLQRRLHIGYPRAAHLMDELEELGVVGPSAGGGREREVLLPPPGDGSDEEPDDNMDDES